MATEDKNIAPALGRDGRLAWGRGEGKKRKMPGGGWGGRRRGAGDGLKETCPPQTRKWPPRFLAVAVRGHAGSRHSLDGGGWGKGLRSTASFRSSLRPGNYLHSPGSLGVAAWTKAQRGCQLVPMACAFRSLLPDQRHVLVRGLG